jgi:hypothetical protein
MSVGVDPAGIVRLSWMPGLRITGYLAANAMAAVDTLNGQKERPLLVDMTGTAVVTREARQVFTRKCTASRIALLGKSAVDKVLVNFALAVNPVPAPTRFFTSEPAALAWLRDGAPDA